MRQVRSHLAPTRERRDPRAATVARDYRGLDQPMIAEWDAEQAFRLGIMSNAVAYRCLQVWADTVGSFQFCVGDTPPARPGSRGSDHKPTARMAQLLGRPTTRVNGRRSGPTLEMTGRDLMMWTVWQRIATGRHAWELEWDGRPGESRIVGLWPLPAAHLKPKPTSGRAARYFDGFVYDAENGYPIPLSNDQVFYGWWKGPNDVRQPVSPLQATRYAVTLAVMSDRYNHAFLKNGAVPATVVTTEAFSSDDERQAFQKGWAQRYQGPDRAGRTAFHEVGDGEGPVGDAIDIKTLGLAQKDAEFAKSHLQALKEVAYGLGVPWSKIDSADRTFSNAEAEERSWMLEKVVPFLETLADEINHQLAHRLGSEVGWFDLSGVEALRPKPRFTFAEGIQGVDAGLLLPAEVRDEFGLDPDVALPEPTMPALPAGGIGPAPVAIGGGSLAPGLGSGADRSGTGAGAADGAPADPARRSGVDVRGAAPEQRALTAEQQEQRRATIWRRNDAALRGLEARFARAWSDYFKRQAKAVVGQLTGKRTAARLTAASTARELRADLGIGGPLDPAEIARWRAAALDLADLMHTAATTAGVTRVNNAFGVSFDLEAPFVQDFIRARANQLAGQVTDSTYSAVQQALADGVANGASIDDLASAVQDVFTNASTNRAKTIARTEVISASNGSATLTASQLPPDVCAGQEWISTRDDRTRGNDEKDEFDHLSVDGQVVAMGAPFEVGGESLLYPGDPDGDGGNVINCRCTVAFLTPKDMEGRSAPRRTVPLTVARLAFRTLRAGEPFDAAEFRRSLLEVAA